MCCKETVFFFTALALFFCLDACENANSKNFVAKESSFDEENSAEVFDSTHTQTYDSMIEVYHPELLLAKSRECYDLLILRICQII